MEKAIWLFEGDSVTDCGRNRQTTDLGHGYVHLLQEELTEIKMINRGISGHRLIDLSQRILIEIRDTKPDLLIILIGINDIWHCDTYDKPSDAATFRRDYQFMLDSIHQVNPKLPIILIEPFAFPIVHVKPNWIPHVKKYQEILEELSIQYDVDYVPMQTYLTRELDHYQMNDILHDGIHPSALGHTLIKDYLLPMLKNYI